MKCRGSLLAAVLVVLAAFHGAAQANLTCFTIEGTYAETLLAADGVTVLFSVNDPFMIQGKYDMDLQPTLTKKSGSTTLVDASLDFSPVYVYSLDYGTVTTMGFTGMSLDEINSNHPSNEDDLGNDAVKSAAYVASSYQNISGSETSSFSIEIVNDYTSLVIRNSDGVYDGWIDYHYRLVIEGDPDGIHTETIEHDRITLNITSFETSECTAVVPLPGSVILLASGVAGLVRVRKKLKLEP